MKNVLMLSTTPPILGTTKDDSKKPAIYKVYDFSKGGTDIVDQRMTSYSTRSNSRRWTLHAFAYMCDTARINAQTVLALNKKTDPRKIDSYAFGWFIVDELVKPHLRIRKQGKNLNKKILSKIEDILEEKEEEIGPQVPTAKYEKTDGKRQRCKTCLNQIYGKDFRKNVSKMSTYKQKCTECGCATCYEHIARQICVSCVANDNK